MYKSGHCKTQAIIYASIQKYGWDAHVFEILEEVEDALGDDREIYYIDLCKAYHTDGGMNLTRGGMRPKMTQETKDKLSQSIMGSKNYKAKQLYQYSLTGDFIQVWNCMKDIQRALGYNTTWLSAATKQDKPAYGYRWSYIPMHELTQG